MTWAQQVRGLRRSRVGQAERIRATAKRNREREMAKAPPAAPVYVGGNIAPEFLERMRACGVTVVFRR